MSKPLNRLLAIEKIKEVLIRFDRREPYVSNAAMRIYALIFDDEINTAPGEHKDNQYLRGYNSGYRAGERAAKKRGVKS